jgi:PrtD family type I secretion system ABC transporter
VLKAIFDRTKTNPLREAVRGTVPAMRSVAGISFFLNLLVFAPSLYMESSFDRVLTSRNVTTWGFLTAVLVLLVLTHGVLTVLRQRILTRVGIAFDHVLSDPLFVAIHRVLNGEGRSEGRVSPVQAMRDLDTVRENLSGKLVATAVDLLFVPLFVFALTLMHPFIGLGAVVIMLCVVACGFAINLASAGSTLRATAAGIHANDYATTMLRNSEVIQALGMLGALQARWKRLRDAGLQWQAMAADQGNIPNIILASLTFAGSTLVVAIAVILAVENMASAGILFGAMIIAAKAIAPMASLAKNWKAYVSAQYAFERIDKIFNALPAVPERMALPKPSGNVRFEAVTAMPPRGGKPVLRDVSFDLPAGEVLGVIGPSAAGKSSLARVLLGIWPVASGAVRIDGNEISHWDPDELGRHIGYIPQDVELFAGTVAENIARFGDASPEQIIEAARMAGVHELIQSLPEGYNTDIGDAGVKLSGGQRQRLALARAVLGTPPIVVLDEPNASLDVRGEECLVEAIRQLSRNGSSVVIITHRSNMVSHVDRILVLSEGTVHLYGAREEVMRRLGMPNVVPMPHGVPAARPVGRTVPQPESAESRSIHAVAQGRRS